MVYIFIPARFIQPTDGIQYVLKYKLEWTVLRTQLNRDFLKNMSMFALQGPP